jgi:hypothetical protein
MSMLAVFLTGVIVGLAIYDIFVVPIHPRFVKYASGKVLINDKDK